MSDSRDIDVGDDLRLHVVSSGDGSPLLLLHGFTGSLSTWDYFRSKLESDFRVIAVDLPGHGQSSIPASPARYSLDRLSADLETVLDDLEIDRAAVFGYSMGGRAALRFALNAPARLSALILESTTPGIGEAGRPQRAAADGLLADMIERDGVAAFVARWERLPLWNTQARMPDAGRRALHDQRLANDPRGLANSLRGAGSAADPDVTGRLGEIQAPTLVFTGELDSKYIEIGRILESGIPNAEMQIIPGAGHAIHLEQPDAVIDAIRGFLSAGRNT
ncbi:MAG TPA: 2-succinyl-6-hydroxy-2,4-cyclohexadiene-1-carboxylate synthase [Gemmatimonadaceae bacterium]|nr:2-succinyl-6-hydroxy-2,4-cyclohexadiene-1-carboxylate synthase [Gemmatimonadaceae bacterium]